MLAFLFYVRHLSLYLYLLSDYQHMKQFSAYFLIINLASRRRRLQLLLQSAQSSELLFNYLCLEKW